MATVATDPRLTPEDLLNLPEADRFELVDGQLVERKNMSAESAWVTLRTNHLLCGHCDAHPEADVFPSDASFQCFPDEPDKVRRADGSVIRRGRLSHEQFVKGHVRIAPDLTLEVLSPNDLVYEVDEKVEEWRSAGVQLVWVIDPKARTVTVHRAGAAPTLLGETDELTAEPVLTGFRCRVAELFPGKA